MKERPKIERYRGLLPTVKQLRFLREAGCTEMSRTRPEASRMIDELRLDEVERGYDIDPYDFCF